MRPFLLAAAAALLYLGAGTLPAQTPRTHEHGFAGAEHWARYFDDPERDAWQKPHEVIQALALAPDSLVADIGSGTGYFAVRLAHFVPKGRVYGVDTEPDMVKYLAERARREGLTNVSSITGKPDDPKLPVKVDAILVVDVYHHIANRKRYFERLKQALKPGGRVAVIDFHQKAPMGPPPGSRIPPERVKAEMHSAGYALQAEHAFLPHQYFLVFAPAKG